MRITTLVLTFILSIVLAVPQAVQAKEYTIPTIRVEVQVQPDGTVRITEHRTYKFEGDDFSWADYRLPFRGFKSITDIRVAENGQPFTNENSEEPGTFMVSRNDDQVQIKWFYNAEDEERTFSISYTLEGALVIGPAWAEFFWNYLSPDREKDTRTLRIDMQLPAAVGTDSMYSWKRGPQDNITLQETSAGYTVRATNIDDDEFVKIRSVFPRSVFDEGTVTTNDSDFTLAWARQDEKNYQEAEAKRQARQARYAAYGQQLTIVIALLSILAFLFFYRKYGTRHSAGTVSSTETIMIPGRLKPAVAGWLLMKRNIGSPQLMATILDLARRKHFIIKEEAPEKKWMGGEKKVFSIERTDTQPQDELADWEADLADFVNTQIKNNNNRIDKLFSESSYKASKWFSSWKKKVNNHCKTFGWYDQESYTGVYGNVAVQIFLLIASIIATVWAGPVGIVGITITTLFLIGSMAIIRRTPEGERTYKRWKAYREGLKNAGRHSFEQDVLDKHFIYAVAFGLSKDDIQTVFEQYSGSEIVFYWFVFHGDGVRSASEVAGTFSTLSATGASAFPGATGGGAGASAGAAGGGASGGAG